ncbi:MAG: ABC transporter permease subunit [Spirochaetaceae bacterium]|nr:ABC transporter permease subunit [Spirochaetaceae bacterium]
MLPALLVSFAAGIGAGSFIGLNKRARDLLMPLFRALNPIPSTMLIPYAIAILPTFRVASIAIIAIGVFWPAVRNTVNGITYLEPRWIDNARCLNIRGPSCCSRLFFPAQCPKFLSALNRDSSSVLSS